MPRGNLWWRHETSAVFSGFARQDAKADRAVLTLSEWLIVTRQFAPNKVKFFLKRRTNRQGDKMNWKNREMNHILNCGYRYESEHDPRSWMNNLSGWKRAWKKKTKQKQKTWDWPGIATWSTQRSIHCANQSNWRAGHCEFVNYPMVEIAWMEIQSNPSTTATLGGEESGRCREVAVMGR